MGKYGDFDATVSAQVVTGESSYELVFTLTLDCISPSLKEIPAGLISPGEPSEAPEFELDVVSINNNKSVVSLQHLTEGILRTIVGPEIANELIADAIQQAIESGEF